MKTTLNLSFSLMLSFLCFISFSQNNTIEKVSTHTDSIIHSQHFTFVATMALPTSGESRYLNGDYTLNITKDSIQSFLPFYGRAYTAPFDPNDNGIKFISKDFDYKLTVSEKGNYEISIRPRGVRNGYQLYLSISKNGYSSLRVSSNNRESISFYGRIQ
jgi:hypothetical protein